MMAFPMELDAQAAQRKDNMANNFKESKEQIIEWHRGALSFFGEGECAGLIGTELLTTAIEKTVTLIYERLGDAGFTKPFLAQPSLKEKCEAVAAWLKDHSVPRFFIVSPEVLWCLMHLGGAVKHQIPPRIDKIGEKMMGAQFVLAELFQYYFGEPLPFDDDSDDLVEDDTLGSMSGEEAVSFVVSTIRRRIAQHMTPEEMKVFDVMPKIFIGGAADPITLRKAQTWEAWHKFNSAGMRDITPALMQSTRDEPEALLADRAVQVLLDLKSFIAAEAWHYRRSGKYADIAHLSSDAELALLSVGEQFGWC
jgi:hypothetical protein